MLIAAYPLMGALAYGLLCIAFAIPIADVIAIWRDRPLVMWDVDHQRWRSARLIRREREGR